MITGAQLKRICTTVAMDRCILLARLMDELCLKYGVANKDEFEEFLANVAQESMEFGHKQENMNYRASTMMKVWPRRFPDFTSCYGFAGVPRALANRVYGDRMGNRPGTDDGWNFRGGGFIGLTGREVYTKYAEFIGVTPEKAAELVRTTDEYAMDSAFWFFYVLKNLEGKAVQDDFVGIVKSINGGLIGLDVRKKYYELVKLVLG